MTKLRYDDIVAATWLGKRRSTSFHRLRRLPLPAVDTFIDGGGDTVALQVREFDSFRQARIHYDTLVGEIASHDGTRELPRESCPWPFTALWLGTDSAVDLPREVIYRPPVRRLAPDNVRAVVADPAMIAFVSPADGLVIRVAFGAGPIPERAFSGLIALDVLRGPIDGAVLDDLRWFSEAAKEIAIRVEQSGTVVTGMLVSKYPTSSRIWLGETVADDSGPVRLPLSERLALTDITLPWLGQMPLWSTCSLFERQPRVEPADLEALAETAGRDEPIVPILVRDLRAGLALGDPDFLLDRAGRPVQARGPESGWTTPPA